MKILYVDSAIDGHHINYLRTLIEAASWEVVAILPEKVSELSCVQYMGVDAEKQPRTIDKYNEYIDRVAEVASIENPDIIHFLTGDLFREFYGRGLHRFKKYRTIMTIHQFPKRISSYIGAFFVAKNINMTVVHADYLRKIYSRLGIKRVRVVDYPSFNMPYIEKSVARDYYHIGHEKKLIVSVGSTRYDKGIDILLQALNSVESDFHLLIAGAEGTIKRETIEELISEYSSKVTIEMRYLTDEEMIFAINAADIVAVPYRKRFNASSGPMVDGVWTKKCIIGPCHGNLGSVINNNHLGYTFISERPDSLSQILTTALKEDFCPDEVYEAYRKKLDKNNFKKSYQTLYKGLLLYDL